MTDDQPRGEFDLKSQQVAYLTNLYPSPSHSFIRREIAALEAAGWQVHRFAHRRNVVAIVDPADIHELGRTSVLLDLPFRSLALAVFQWLVERPLDTIGGIALAMRMARNDRRRYVPHAAYFVMACALSRRLRNLGCCHLHVHFGTNPASVARLANRLCGLRYSATFHGPHEYEPGQERNLCEKIKGALFVAAVSETGLRRLLEDHPKFAAKFRLIRCGLDASWMDAAARARKSGTDLVCVARLEGQKDPLLLLEAVSILVERGVTFQLRIAGDGSLRAQMETYIQEQALSRHVLLLGWQSQQEVFDHLCTSRALVLSSRDEGLPVAIMEAFSLGVPAIAPDVGGVHELVQTGVSGWLVPSGDSMALADAMHECLLATPDEIMRMGVEVRRRIQPFEARISASSLAQEFQRGRK